MGHKPNLISHPLQKLKKVTNQPAQLEQVLTLETETFYSKPMVVIPKPGAELKGSVLSEATTFEMQVLPSHSFLYPSKGG